MRKYLKILVAMALLFSIASCQKNEEFSSNPKKATLASLVTNDEEALRGNNPSIINYLDNLYGDLYDINTADGLQNQFSDGNSTVIVWAFPFKYVNIAPYYLTVVYTTYTNVLGLYILYFDNTEGDATETIYGFSVYDPDDMNYGELFSGYAMVYNNSHLNDILQVSNGTINIPSTYTYPIFDNITSGNKTLLTLPNNSVDEHYSEYSELEITIIRLAATFYTNFYGS